jgi:hypothetical protein
MQYKDVPGTYSKKDVLVPETDALVPKKDYRFIRRMYCKKDVLVPYKGAK